MNEMWEPLQEVPIPSGARASYGPCCQPAVSWSLSLASNSPLGLPGFGVIKLRGNFLGRFSVCCWVTSLALKRGSWWEAVLGEISTM